jgi:hypothetical protein
MNLTLIALVIVLLGIAPIPSLDRLAVPETLWLTMWGVGLLATAAGVKSLTRLTTQPAKPHDYVVKAA